MLSILGSLLGFAGSAVPAITDHFAAKEDRKLELDKMKLMAELKKDGMDFDMKLYEQQAAGKEHERLIQHDISINKGTGIIAGLQKSVRPVITYAFFGLFCQVPPSLITCLVHVGPTSLASTEHSLGKSTEFAHGASNQLQTHH